MDYNIYSTFWFSIWILSYYSRKCKYYIFKCIICKLLQGCIIIYNIYNLLIKSNEFYIRWISFVNCVYSFRKWMTHTPNNFKVWAIAPFLKFFKLHFIIFRIIRQFWVITLHFVWNLFMFIRHFMMGSLHNMMGSLDFYWLFLLKKHVLFMNISVSL